MLDLHPSFEPDISMSLFILSFGEKVVNVAETEIAWMQVFRYYDNRILLVLHDHINSHLFILDYILFVVCWSIGFYF